MEDDFDISKLQKSGKRRKNSKVKGNTFERKVCDILNERFNTTDFCRTPGSGAFATTHSLPEHLKIYGDIVTPKDFKFVIECKKGYNKENLCSLFNSNSILIDMIAQSVRDAEKSKKRSLLILAQDRKNPIVLLECNPVLYDKFHSGCAEAGSSILLRIGNKHYTIVTLKELLLIANDFFFESH